MKKQINILILVLIVLLSFAACRGDAKQLKSENDLPGVKIHRIDLEFAAIDSTKMKESVKQLYTDHSKFLQLYMLRLENLSPADSVAVAQALSAYIQHPAAIELHKEVRAVLQDVSYLEKELSVAFEYLNKDFPSLQQPEFYLYTSGLHTQYMHDPGMGVMGISSEFYLGEDFELYKSLFYDYMLPQMNPNQLGIDFVSNLLFSSFRFEKEGGRLIDYILYRGKVLYLQSVVMPKRAEHEIVSYTPDQIKWAQQHEKEIWNKLVGQKDLFSSDQFLIRKYIDEAPFTSSISAESPGRLGEWIGLQIIKSYMKSNRKTTLPELMKTDDYQYILEKSKYHP